MSSLGDACRFCCICLESKTSETFIVLPCVHWFCRACLGQMVQKVCPLCRSPFGDENEKVSSQPIVIDALSRSAPSGSAFRRPPSPHPVESRSADEFETLINTTGLQNTGSLSRILSALERKQRTRRRRLRRLGYPRQRRRPLPSLKDTPSSFPPIFPFDDDA